MEAWREELYHHGIKGQKWGVRRYQNLDGTLTAEGRARFNTDVDHSNSLRKNGKVIAKTGTAYGGGITGAAGAVYAARKYDNYKRTANYYKRTSDYYKKNSFMMPFMRRNKTNALTTPISSFAHVGRKVSMNTLKLHNLTVPLAIIKTGATVAVGSALVGTAMLALGTYRLSQLRETKKELEQLPAKKDWEGDSNYENMERRYIR